MFKTFGKLIGLFFFLVSPAALPYSYALLGTLAAATALVSIHFTIELGLLNEIYIPLDRVILLVSIYVLSIIFVISSILSYKGQSSHFLKTAIAWFFVEAIVAAGKGAMLVSFFPINTSPWMRYLFIFLVLYELLLKGHIMRLSLGISWAIGIIYVICIGILSRIPVLLAAMI